MLKALVFPVVLFLSGCALFTKADRIETPKTVSFSRYLMISACYNSESACRPPVAKNLELANTTALFIDGIVYNSVILSEDEINFTGLITIKAQENDYLIELKLVSDNGEKVVRQSTSFTVKSLNDITETVLMDKPINFKQGILRAQLVFGPVITNTK